MAVHNLIQFTDSSSGVFWTATYDDATGTVNATPDTATTDFVTTAADMGVAVGTVLYQACEGYTRVTIKADINFPFCIQERQENSAACGYTGPVGSITQTTNSVNAFFGVRTQSFKIGDFVPTGCIYHLLVYGHEVTYTSVAGNTANDVVLGLRDAVNATTTTEWNELGLAPAPGTPGYPPVAASFGVGSSTLSLTLNKDNQFSAWVTDGLPTALAFTFSLSKTNETFAGAHDGTVEVTATDTMQLTYTYSLDGINYQVSNVFTGLLPGNYIIYVKGASVQSSLIKTSNFTIVAGAIPATNIDFPWEDKFCYWFKLIRNGTEYVVSEPIKWDSVNIMGKRDLDWHGWNYQYSDGVIELEFDCPAGKEVIMAEYETNGSDGSVLFQYGYTYKGTEYLLFPGKLNLNKYKELPQKVACSVEREDFNAVLQARFETKVSLDATTTLDGTTIAPPAPVEFTLHSKEILRTFKADNNTLVQGPQQTFFLGPVYILPDTSAAQLTEIEEFYTYSLLNGYSENKPYELDLYNFKIKFAGVYNFNFGWQLNIKIYMAPPILVGPAECYIRSYYRKKNLNGFVQVLLREQGPISFVGTNEQGVAHFVDIALNDLSLEIDDEIYFWTEIVWTANDNIKAVQVDQVYINTTVTGLDTAPATTCKGWWLFDAIDHGIKVTTDKKSLLKSEFLSLKNAQQAVDGGGALMTTTNGKQIRNFDIANAPLQTSLKDLLSSARAIWCLGMGFEKAGALEVVRVERANYFFQNREILVIEECWDYKKETAIDVLYNEFEFGYEKYQESGYNTLDELNTKSEGLTPIKTNKMKLSQKSKLITSGYSIEDSRRQQFAKTSTNSYQNDDEAFLISMRRVNADEYAPEKNEAFDIVNNVISPSTAYNLRLSPIRILLNWAIWLKNAFYFKASTEKIKVTYVAQNANAQTRFKSTEPLPVGDLNKSLWTEKQDIDLTNYPVAERLWRPEWVTFKCRLTPDKVLTINEALRGRKSSGINYGYIVVKDHKGDYQAGWPYELNYNFATEQAEFKMRMKWDSPVTPGADCCQFLVINGCNILINGNKLIV